MMEQIILLLIGFSIVFTFEDIEFKGELDTNQTYVWPLAVMNETTVTSALINYEVTYEEAQCYKCKPGVQTKCCPHLLFYSAGRFKKQKHNATCEEHLSHMSVSFAFNIWNIALYETADSARSGCRLSNGIVTCNDSIEFSHGFPTSVIPTFAACNSSNGLRLRYKITIKHIATYRIERNTQLACPGYKYIAFPGLLGFTSRDQFITYSKSFRGLTLKKLVQSCYKYGWLLICRMAVPELRNGKQILPCEEFCEELAKACHKVFKTIGVVTFCKNLKKYTDYGDKCFNMRVNCLEAEAPKYGSVNVTSLSFYGKASYKCDEGYALDGHTYSICDGTGEWNLGTPKCRLNTTEIGVSQGGYFGYSDIIILSVIFAVFGIGSLLVSGIVLYRKRYIKRKIHVGNLEPRSFKYDVFVSYSSEDAEFVEEELRIRLEEESNPPYKLCIHGRDFLAGPTIHENIYTNIVASRMTLIMLSKSYSVSPWCQHEFSIAFHRMVDEGLPRSAVVLVFLEDIPREELSAEIQSYCYTCTYIYKQHTHFWKQIVNAVNEIKHLYSNAGFVADTTQI